MITVDNNIHNQHIFFNYSFFTWANGKFFSRFFCSLNVSENKKLNYMETWKQKKIQNSIWIKSTIQQVKHKFGNTVLNLMNKAHLKLILIANISKQFRKIHWKLYSSPKRPLPLFYLHQSSHQTRLLYPCKLPPQH